MARVIIPEATSGKCFTHKEVFFRPSATVRLYYWPKLKVQLAKMIKVIENCRWRPKGISEGVTPALSWPLLGAFLLYSPLFTSIPFQDQKLAMNGFDQVSRHISELSLWLSLSWTCWISEIWPALLEISYSAEKQQQNVIERWDLRLKI